MSEETWPSPSSPTGALRNREEASKTKTKNKKFKELLERRLPGAEWCQQQVDERGGPGAGGYPAASMSMFDEMKHAVHNVYKGAVESVTSVSHVSQFRQKGVLTPEEFVAAGDLLVDKCPSWSWEAGEPTKAKEYLPKNKQFLITRNVPCHRRVAAIGESVLECGMDDDEDAEWTNTANIDVTMGGAGSGADIEDIDDVEDVPQAAAAQGVAQAPAAADMDEDEVPDMDDLDLDDDGVIEVDPSALAPAGGTAKTKDEGFVRTRSYNISITYDKYYQVPRCWLFGFDEESKALTHEQVFQDMSQDHAKKTVTIDPHPHTSGVAHASIHPCKHSATLKKIIDQMESGDGPEMRSDMSLLLFLKFLSSIIPTIEYDFTVNFDTGGVAKHR